MNNKLQTIKAIVVDDERKSRSIIRKMIAHYCPLINLVGEASSAKEGIELIQTHHPKLVFLDIEMPYASGFDMLNDLQDTNFEVIFITAFDEYALMAIRAHALDYLVKPISIEELVNATEHCIKVINQQAENQRLKKLVESLQDTSDDLMITVVTNEGRVFVKVCNIIRLEADGGYTHIYMVNGDRHYSSKNLGEFEKAIMEKKLARELYFRVHHSHLVNIKQINAYHSKEMELVMNDMVRIKIAQRRKAQFQEVLKRHQLI